MPDTAGEGSCPHRQCRWVHPILPLGVQYSGGGEGGDSVGGTETKDRHCQSPAQKPKDIGVGRGNQVSNFYLFVMDFFFLGHNEDNFLKFWPELSLTYAVNFFKGRFIIEKASYLCTTCI